MKLVSSTSALVCFSFTLLFFITSSLWSTSSGPTISKVDVNESVDSTQPPLGSSSDVSKNDDSEIETSQGTGAIQIKAGTEVRVFPVFEVNATIPREKKWDAALPPENIPEFRKEFLYPQHCGFYNGAKPFGPTDKRPKIFFFNTYNGEGDLLEIKLDEAYPVVDYIIILESNTTFRHQPKPIYFSMDDPRFARYKAKIIHHIYLPMSAEELRNNTKGSFGMEVKARAEAYKAVQHIIEIGDLIMQSDVDEIVRREALEVFRVCKFEPRHFPAVFLLTFNYFNFYSVHKGKWYAPRIGRYTGDVEENFDRKLGTAKHHIKVFFRRAGWHCSWCLLVKDIVKKIETFSHTELDLPRNKGTGYILGQICRGKIFFRQRKDKQGAKYRALTRFDLTPGNKNLHLADLPMHVIRNIKQYSYLLPGNCTQSP